jgi:hypothetical protein
MPGLAGKPFRTRETEAIDTPARFATVTTVATGLALRPVNVFTKASERYAAGHRLSTDAAPAMPRLGRGLASSSCASSVGAISPRWTSVRSID